jgi:UDP-N-acetylmuramoyl-tripeptide--D-alanyl-D-alanine ligase
VEVRDGRLIDLGRDALGLAARTYRRRLRDTTFVSVTGSAGKTTTVRLLEAVLATRGPISKEAPGPQQILKAARTVFAVRRRHWACVHHTAAWGPGTIDRLVWILQPRVGVVTTVGDDHLVAFRGRDAVAREKAKVVAALPPDGVAVLNADDERVLAMASETRARVVTYGRSAAAEVRAEDVSASFPDRLAFTVVVGGRRVRVQTQLVGELWVTSALAAIAAGWALGVPPDHAVEALAAVAPHPRRLEPVELERGATILRDDVKASGWTIGPALDVLAAASAKRKIAVIGRISDDSRRGRVLYRDVAREARRHADLVVVVGEWAHYALKARESSDDEAIVALKTVDEAIAYLDAAVRAGDLVLVKSNRRHLERLTEEAAAWR